jgi:hypothetical protein
MKIGDAISTVAIPVARTLGMDCIDPETRQLKPESGCAKMKENLNSGMNLAEAMFDRFWPSSNSNKPEKK